MRMLYRQSLNLGTDTSWTNKMKKIVYLLSILIAFGIFPSSSFAQEEVSVIFAKNDKGLAEYTEVVSIDSTIKSDIYTSALEWVNKTYKSGKSVIQTTDKDGGMILGKAVSPSLIYNNSGFKVDGGYFSYTISIFCKDNKFKYIIDNITYNKGEMALKPGADLAEDFPHNWTGLIGKNKQTRREWKSFQRQADTEFKFVIEDLKSHMKNSKKKNDW